MGGAIRECAHHHSLGMKGKDLRNLEDEIDRKYAEFESQLAQTAALARAINELRAQLGIDGQSDAKVKDERRESSRKSVVRQNSASVQRKR